MSTLLLVLAALAGSVVIAVVVVFVVACIGAGMAEQGTSARALAAANDETRTQRITRVPSQNW